MRTNTFSSLLFAYNRNLIRYVPLNDTHEISNNLEKDKTLKSIFPSFCLNTFNNNVSVIDLKWDKVSVTMIIFANSFITRKRNAFLAKFDQALHISFIQNREMNQITGA